MSRWSESSSVALTERMVSYYYLLASHIDDDRLSIQCHTHTVTTRVFHCLRKGCKAAIDIMHATESSNPSYPSNLFSSCTISTLSATAQQKQRNATPQNISTSAASTSASNSPLLARSRAHPHKHPHKHATRKEIQCGYDRSLRRFALRHTNLANSPTT